MIEGRGFRWVRRIGLLVLTAVVSFPLFVMLSASIEPLSDVQKPFRWIPRHVTLLPYVDVWTTLPLAKFLANSAIIAACTAVLALSVAIPAAYALARQRFRGNRIVGLSLLACQFAPGMLFLLPLFLLYAQLHRSTGIQLIGTFPGVILTDLTFALPFSIWMLTGVFANQPPEPEESAVTLGAGVLTVLRRIVLPTSAAAVAAVGTFAFAIGWGEVLFASVLTNDGTRTLSVGLPAYTSGNVPYWDQAMAASLIAAAPVVLAFVVLRRWLPGAVPRPVTASSTGPAT